MHDMIMINIGCFFKSKHDTMNYELVPEQMRLMLHGRHFVVACTRATPISPDGQADGLSWERMGGRRAVPHP